MLPQLLVACEFPNFNRDSTDFCENGLAEASNDGSNFAAFQRLNGQISNLSPREVIMKDNRKK